MQLFAILGYGASCHSEAAFIECCYKLLVGERSAFILFGNQLLAVT